METYKIPLYTYDHRTDLFSVVDKEENLYLGQPSSCVLEDGQTVVVVYPKSHAFGQLTMKRSEDGGKTWSDRLSVPNSFSTSVDCPTIYRLIDAVGKARLCLFSGNYPLRMSVSEDEGEHFTELAPVGNFGGWFVTDMISHGNGRYTALFYDGGEHINGDRDDTKRLVYGAGSGTNKRTRLFSYKTTDGGKTHTDGPYPFIKNSTVDHEGDDWQLIYETYRGLGKYPYRIYGIETTDGGRTWSTPREMLAYKDAFLCEACVIPSPDGKELAMLLREDSRKYRSMVSISRDGGHTWGEPQEMSSCLNGDRHTAVYLPDGRLFVAMRDADKNSPFCASWVAWIGTYEELVAGGDGDAKILIKRNYDANDCAYTALHILGDGTLLATTYGQWEPIGIQSILSMRLIPEELQNLCSKADAFIKPEEKTAVVGDPLKHR